MYAVPFLSTTTIGRAHTYTRAYIMIIAIDVDDTLVPMLKGWFDWVRETYDYDPYSEKFNTYDLGTALQKRIFAQNGQHYRVDPMMFWKNPSLYDDIEIDYNTTFQVRELTEHCTVVFVSHCFPEHETSKRNMLERHFGNINFISTGAKEFVDFDWIIDDNHIVLNRCVGRQRDKKINIIHYKGLVQYNRGVWEGQAYRQFNVNRVLRHKTIECTGWEEIVEAILVKSEW